MSSSLFLSLNGRHTLKCASFRLYIPIYFSSRSYFLLPVRSFSKSSQGIFNLSIKVQLIPTCDPPVDTQGISTTDLSYSRTWTKSNDTCNDCSCLKVVEDSELLWVSVSSEALFFTSSDRRRKSSLSTIFMEPDQTVDILGTLDLLETHIVELWSPNSSTISRDWRLVKNYGSNWNATRSCFCPPESERTRMQIPKLRILIPYVAMPQVICSSLLQSNLTLYNNITIGRGDYGSRQATSSYFFTVLDQF